MENEVDSDVAQLLLAFAKAQRRYAVVVHEGPMGHPSEDECKAHVEATTKKLLYRLREQLPAKYEIDQLTAELLS